MPIKDYLIKNYKDKTIGKELTPYVESGVQMLGNAYQDTMWKARRGILGPHALVGSHAIDTLGKIIPDIPIDKGISHVAHEGLGIDKPLADVGGHIGEMLIARKLLKSGVPAAYNKLNQQPWAHNYMYARGQTLRSNIDRMGKDLKSLKNLAKKGKTAYDERFSPIPSKRVVNTKAQVVDSVFNEPGAIIRRARAIYRNNPDAGWTAAIDAAKQLPQYAANAKIYLGDQPPTSTFMTTTGGRPFVPDDPIQNAISIRRAVNAGFTQGGRAHRFNLKAFLNNNLEDYKRLVASDIATTWHSGLAPSRSPELRRNAAFVNLRNSLLEGWWQDYGDTMTALGYEPRHVNLDHRLTLVQSMGIYHNVDRRSPFHRQLQELALRRGYTPGDAEDNLDLVSPEVHQLKTNFFNDLHGLNTHGNLKYWNGQHKDLVDTNGNPISRFQIMDRSHKAWGTYTAEEAQDLHIQVVEDYFDHVDRGSAILDSAQAVWKANNKKGILPEEVASELMKVTLDENRIYRPEIINATIDSFIQAETEKINNLNRVQEIREELDEYDRLSTPATRSPEDKAIYNALESELRRLDRVIKPNFFKNWLKKEQKKLKGGAQQELDLYLYDELNNQELDNILERLIMQREE